MTRTPRLRFLSALLTVAMLMTLLPTAAFADEGSGATGSALTVTVNKDQSLADAVKTAKPTDWQEITELTVITGNGKELDKDDFQFMSGVVVDTNTPRASATAVNPGTAYSSKKYTGEAVDCLSKLEVLDLTDATCVENAIPKRAFQYNGNITKIYLPENLVRTYLHAFSSMEKLEYLGTKKGNLIFPDTMEIMGEGMLWADKKVTAELTFPASLKAIGSSCFEGSGITGAITIPANVDIYTNTDLSNDNKYDNAQFIFKDTAITSLTLESGITKVIRGIAYGCSQLTTVSLPSTVTEIEYGAFWGTALSALPDMSNITSVGESAFREITQELQGDIELRKGVSYGNSVFRGDKIKGNVTINSDETGMYLFQSTNNAKTVIDGNVTINTDTPGEYLLKDAEVKGDIELNGSSTGKEMMSQVTLDGNLIVGSKTISQNFLWVKDGSYDGTSRLKGTLTLKSGVTTIENSAFGGAGLTGTLTLPEGLETIGDSAFRHNQFSGVIVIPETVTTIGMAAFSYVGGGASNEAPNAQETDRKVSAIIVKNPDIQLSKFAFANQKDSAQIYFASQQAATNSDQYWAASEVIILNTNGGQVDTAKTDNITGLYEVIKTGYTFGGWYTDPTFEDENTQLTGTAAKNHTYHAKWIINNYTVKFVNDGTEVASIAADYNTTIAEDKKPEDPTKTGYTFDGWYNGDEKFTFGENGTKVISDVTLTAKWTPKQYEVSFVVDGETADDRTQEVEYGKTAADPKLSKTGYTLNGWYINESCEGEKFDFATAIKGDTTLYAKWTPEQFTVKFVNDGTEVKSVTADYNTNIAENDKPEDPTKMGHTFSGWYNGDEKFSFGESGTKITGNLTLTAKWDVNEYTVTFDANGHGTAPKAQTVKYKAKVEKPEDPIAEGYTFGGWYTDKECQSAFDFDTEVTEEVTLYAKWTPSKPSEDDKPSTDPTTPSKPSEDDKPSTDPTTPSKPSEDDKPSTDPTKPEPDPEPEKPVKYSISVDNGKAYLEDGETEINTAEAGQTVVVRVNPEAITEGFEFDKWEIVSGEITLEDETASEIRFTMPAGEVELKATVKVKETPAASLTPLEQAMATTAEVAVVGAGAAAVGVAVYGIGTELTARLLLPAGAAMPATNGELALLLWKHAGSPALPVEAPLSETETALRWAVAQGILNEDDTAEQKVSATDVIRAVRKAGK